MIDASIEKEVCALSSDTVGIGNVPPRERSYADVL